MKVILGRKYSLQNNISNFGLQMEHNYSLKPYNTFGIDVRAKHFASFSTIQELKACLANNTHGALLILGGGSNMLFTEDFDGLVLRNEIKGIEVVNEDPNTIYVKAGAGEIWHAFVLQYHLESGEIHTFNKEQCQFGYRESVFKRALKNQYIITDVTFALSKQPVLKTSYGAIQQELEAKGIDQPTIKEISEAVIAIRQSKLPDPNVLGNAGSFFKNPVVSNVIFSALQERYPEIPNYPAPANQVKLAAGWLIEKAGLKGFRKGSCGVHEKQALVLVNYGGSQGREIFDLSSFIIDTIQQQFGVTLEREVNIIPSHENIL